MGMQQYSLPMNVSFSITVSRHARSGLEVWTWDNGIDNIKLREAFIRPWDLAYLTSFFYCIFFDSTICRISYRAEKRVNAIYDCPRCKLNYCDRCSYERQRRGEGERWGIQEISNGKRLLLKSQNFDFKPFYPFKMPDVIGSHRKPQGERGGTNNEVVGTDLNTFLT